MIASGPLPNRLLRMLDAADFELLRPHLVRSGLVRETVLDEARAALRQVCFPHAGTVSIAVGISEGQTVEVAMLGRDSIIDGGAALADGIATSDAVVLIPGTASMLEITSERDHRRLHAGVCTKRYQAIVGAAVNSEPIANISRREHDGTYRTGHSGFGGGRCTGG
jgi:hypothetical protein